MSAVHWRRPITMKTWTCRIPCLSLPRAHPASCPAFVQGPRKSIRPLLLLPNNHNTSPTLHIVLPFMHYRKHATKRHSRFAVSSNPFSCHCLSHGTYEAVLAQPLSFRLCPWPCNDLQRRLAPYAPYMHARSDAIGQCDTHVL